MSRLTEVLKELNASRSVIITFCNGAEAAYLSLSTQDAGDFGLCDIGGAEKSPDEVIDHIGENESAIASVQ